MTDTGGTDRRGACGTRHGRLRHERPFRWARPTRSRARQIETMAGRSGGPRGRVRRRVAGAGGPGASGTDDPPAGAGGEHQRGRERRRRRRGGRHVRGRTGRAPGDRAGAGASAMSARAAAAGDGATGRLARVGGSRDTGADGQARRRAPGGGGRGERTSPVLPMRSGTNRVVPTLPRAPTGGWSSSPRSSWRAPCGRWSSCRRPSWRARPSWPGLLRHGLLGGRGLLGRCLLRRTLAGEHRVLERLQRGDTHATRRLDADRLTGLRVAAHARRHGRRGRTWRSR